MQYLKLLFFSKMSEINQVINTILLAIVYLAAKPISKYRFIDFMIGFIPFVFDSFIKFTRIYFRIVNKLFFLFKTFFYNSSTIDNTNSYFISLFNWLYLGLIFNINNLFFSVSLITNLLLALLYKKCIQSSLCLSRKPIKSSYFTFIFTHFKL